jgi:hypothetical protein
MIKRDVIIIYRSVDILILSGHYNRVIVRRELLDHPPITPAPWTNDDKTNLLFNPPKILNAYNHVYFSH